MYNKKKSYRKKFHPLKILFFIGMAVVFVFVVGMVVMLLWNSILPRVTGFKTISFWEALGMFLLFRILFGGLRRVLGYKKRGFGPRRKWKEKWQGMKEEDKQKFKQKWREHCRRKEEE